jgi:hypothetical protein
MEEVKKLSKQSESAADQAQMYKTSSDVCANLADVRHRPNGRPKYSSCQQMTTNNGAKHHTRLTYMATIT